MVVEEVGRLHQAVNIRPAMISLFPFFLFHFFILSKKILKILKITKKFLLPGLISPGTEAISKGAAAIQLKF